MSRVTISMKAARALESFVGTRAHLAFEPADVAEALAHLRRAMEPKRKPRKPRDTSPLGREIAMRDDDAALARKARKQENRTSIREAVVKRAMDAGRLCECGCGQAVRDDDTTHCYPEARGEMDHFWGRGKGRPPESLETCWFLRPACHLAKTRNQPDARMWLQKYVAHCARYGYSQEQARATSRLAFVETRSTLGAGLKERNNA